MKIENLFLLLSIFIGMLLIFIIPPFQSPDEDSHFLKSYLISKIDVYPEQRNDVVGYDIPENMDNYIQDEKNMIGDLSRKYTYEDEYFDQLLSYSYESKHFREISTQGITPVAHIVPAFGIFIGNLNKSFDQGGDVTPAVLLQFARAACVIVYSLIGFFAIKISPKFKRIMFTILMLPTSLFLRSTITYDSLLLVIIALSFGKMLQMYCEKDYKFKKKDALILIICGYILLNVKVVYSSIFLMMLIIPSNVFGKNKDKIKYYAIMIGIVLLLTLVSKIPLLQFDVPADKLAQEQMKFITNNPFKFIKIVFNNIINQRRVQSYWMVGTYGLLDTYISPLMVNIIYINLIIIMVYEILKEKLQLSGVICIVYALLMISSVFGIYAVMYSGWTPMITGDIGGNEITGVQGRYFLPCLFTVPLIFSNKITSMLSNKLKKIMNKLDVYFKDYYYLVPVFTILVMIITLFKRFWI